MRSCRSVGLLLALAALGAGPSCTPQTPAAPPGETPEAGRGGTPTRPPLAGPVAGAGGAAGAAGGSSSGTTAGSGGAGGGQGGSGGGGSGGGTGERPSDAGGQSRDAAGRADTAGAGNAMEGGVAVDIGPTASPPRPFQAPGIVAYWGQNGVSHSIADPTKQEKSLADTCRENPVYEMVVIGFVIQFFSPDNIDRTPRLNFSKHCDSKNA